MCVKGNYHFITPPPPTSGTLPGGGSWLCIEFPTLFDDYYHRGREKIISGNIPDLGIGTTASIGIPHNYVITIYECKNYEGKARTFAKSEPNFNEEFYGGSAKIWKVSVQEIIDFNTGTSPENINEILKEHNKYREELKIPPLEWDYNLEYSAKQWANTLAVTYRPAVIPAKPHDEYTKYGENIHYGYSGTWTGKISTEQYSWGAEKQCFKNGFFPDIYQGPCNYNSKCNKDWTCAAHYSQMIWKTTTKVGGARTGYYWVCRYNPPGNTKGQQTY